MASREVYSGSERKLLLAFDVGTTYSGISYSILDPGKEPEIQGVHKFPGQEMAGGTAKLPSIIYYDKNGKVRAVGAEAEGDNVEVTADEENWHKVEWFKLHLRPKSSDLEASAGHLKPLPLGKTVVEVLSDFLKYLKTCAEQYIQEVHPGIGSDVWDGREIHYILSHPNGWEGPQRALMRQAAEKAGLVSSTGRNQLTFITEGEASLNRCIEKGLMTGSVRTGEGISIVDAGGGTLDISAYACMADGKKFEEIAEAQCHFKGSIFVTEAAEKHLKTFLKGSKFHNDIPSMKQYFDKTTKCSFRASEPNDPHYIRFGSARDKDMKYKITAGKLRLEGATVASFFEPSIKCIVDGVLAQRAIAHKPISNVFLVGGFAASDYLFSKVKEQLEQRGLHVFRPDTQINKVVADGAISGILDKPVGTRVSRYSSGVLCSTTFFPFMPDHIKRRHTCVRQLDGGLVVPGYFSVILGRNVQVSETQEFRSPFINCDRDLDDLRKLTMEVTCYRGQLGPEKHKWVDHDPLQYHEVCTIEANLSSVPIPMQFGPSGPYYEVQVDVVLLFGLTELKAQIAWTENGVEKRGPAEIIYDTDI
ncbi:hypothetical protein AGABI2DRAFT_192178 [Agaricus bisporus var. bisporus H97]|uniref:hypothetical protein n=1 Tax=Agaricus bisporus var. bisporus (strain H97 / ATCC MYA-4626 / FGSC 10389) TaxID=936046 RepID=UPI00029F7515|nr:hypothetical protein AGABI2DRAFT_192178 [Agaricus bisporus var. bisporus H97]EKV48618.1 hypothetical protein AGABI2DRAFT_192178 [Agaricus bisporus var. bisporus H97]